VFFGELRLLSLLLLALLSSRCAADCTGGAVLAGKLLFSRENKQMGL